MLGEIKKTYPETYETPLNIYSRTKKFKDHLNSFIKSEKGKEGQIVVVGHSTYFSYLLARKWPILKESKCFDMIKVKSKEIKYDYS